jgi:hypothetical protein
MSDSEEMPTSYYGNPDEEIVFNYIDPELFTKPVMEYIGAEPDSLSYKAIHALSTYAVQLALGTHPPKIIREIEEARWHNNLVEGFNDFQYREDMRQQESDDRMKALLNDGLQDPSPLDDILAEILIRETDEYLSAPVIDGNTWKGDKLPRLFRTPDGELVVTRPKGPSKIAEILNRPNPYKGYRTRALLLDMCIREHWFYPDLSVEEVENILWQNPKYNRWFMPGVFVNSAALDLETDTSSVVGRRSMIAAKMAVEPVIELYGLDTKQWHHERMVQSRGPIL